MQTACRLLVSATLMLAALPVWCADSVLRAVRVPQETRLSNPDAPFWRQAKPVRVAMLPQVVAKPTNPSPAVKSLRVRAVHNGSWVAVLLEWKDPTRDVRVGIDKFGDQAAVQIPVRSDPLPSPMMGHAGARVDIWQWRAAFQRDIDEGPQELHELYPNALVDLYPDQVLRATDARPYMGAVGLDNPVSHPRASPVLDQMAEGWGTMTVEPEQDADGKGVWRNGTWRVVIAHTLFSAATESDHGLRPGDKSVIAFAVWDGGSREVGSRKAWSNWTPIVLAK